MSAGTLPPRSKWIGSMSTPAFGLRAAAAIRAPCWRFLTSVHGMGSRSKVSPSGAPRSHNAIGFEAEDLDVERAYSGIGEAARELTDHRRIADRRPRRLVVGRRKKP